MSVSAERALALLAAEDGELLEADEALGAVIARLERDLAARPDARDLIHDLCCCLLDRARVRGWAVRPAQALQDLARAEPLAEGLGPVNRRSLRIQLLDSRARLLGAPHLPVHDAPAAWQALALLRGETALSSESWIPDAVELQLAQHGGDWQRVAELAESLTGLLQARGQSRGVHALHSLAARAWLQLGRPERALLPAGQAHAFFRAEGPPDIAAQAALALARARGRAADWPLAQEALAGIEQLTRAQRSVFDQQRLLVEKLQLFDDALRLALALAADEAAKAGAHASADGGADAGADASANSSAGAARERALLEAWQVAERAKSFSLRQALSQGGWLQALDAECAAELADLDAKLEAVEAHSGLADTLSGRHAELTAQRQTVLQRAMQRTPLLARVQAPPALDLAATLRSLPEGVGAVSFYWLAESAGWSLQVFHAGADRVPRLATTSWSAAEVEALAQARQSSARVRPFRLKQLLPAALGDKLLPPPVLEALAGCHTLLLTAHRQLSQLPLHALQLSAAAAPGGVTGAGRHELLIERFAVQLLPTLALPFPSAALRERPWRVLLLGCGEDGFGHPPLGDVPLELEALASAWSAGGHAVEKQLLPPQARPAGSAALSRWPEFDVLHLACHGRFMAGSPLDASLYLGRDAVRGSDVFGLALRAEVVSLSACDVGRHGDTLDGLTLRGDEWLGLALPLFQAGARHLLTSLWQANSAVARAFMQEFHAALAAGASPARAHQRACLSQRHLPYGFWANWQLAGFPSRGRRCMIDAFRGEQP